MGDIDAGSNMTCFCITLLLKTFEVEFRFLCHVITKNFDSCGFLFDLSLTFSKRTYCNIYLCREVFILLQNDSYNSPE